MAKIGCRRPKPQKNRPSNPALTPSNPADRPRERFLRDRAGRPGADLPIFVKTEIPHETVSARRLVAHGHARHRLCPRGVGVSLRRRPPARSAVPARNAHGALLRAAAVVRKPAAGNPRHRLPCAGDPRHRIPLADAGPCGGARRRRRRECRGCCSTRPSSCWS